MALPYRSRHGLWRPADRSSPTRARTARPSAVVATVVSVTAMILWSADLATRPPCPPGYVRLLDIDPAARFLSGMLVVASAGVLWASMRRRPGRAVVVLGLLLTMLSAGDAVLAAGALASEHAASVSNCWTF